MKKYILLLLLFTSCGFIEKYQDSNIQMIKIYQGMTTIPPMAFFEDLVTSDISIPKIFHTSRFKSEKLDFDKYNIVKIQAIEAVFTKTTEFLKKYPNAKVEIHIQIFLNCFDYGKLLKLIPKDRIESIHLYDDGTEDYINLYQWKSNSELEEFLAIEDKKTENFFKTGSSSISEHRYSLEKVYPWQVVQHMLRPDYLDLSINGNKLDPIKNRITSNITIDFENMSKILTTEQKQLYFDLIGFEQKVIKDLYDNSPNPNFALTGTTIWSTDLIERNFFADQHINIFKNLIEPTKYLNKYFNGKQYNFFFKLHPRGDEINDKIVATFPDYYRLPDTAGYESLIVSGLIPKKTGGILSSLYFSLPKDKISFLVFKGSRAEAQEDSLVQVMKELDIIQDSQLYFWDELNNTL